MNILVLPSIRKTHAEEFFKNWKFKGGWDHAIIVEDNPEPTFQITENNVTHYSWQDIDKDLGENAWIISRRDSAIRCFGFIKAHAMGAKFIHSLDDDCYPNDYGMQSFCNLHQYAMQYAPQWTESILGVPTRGFPYKQKGNLKNVVANMGLWTENPDWDAVQSLSENTPDFNLPKGNRIVAQGQYFPFCGMNFCFRAEMTPATYFPLMGLESPYRRFDDIWFGIIFKKICDHLGYLVSIGQPTIRHVRASDPFENLVKEAPGIKMNEIFWQKIDQIQLKNKTPKGCMQDIGKALEPEEDEYLSKLGKAIQIWASFF